MNIQFKGTNYELESEITELATKKLEGLEKYFGRHEKPALLYVDLGKHTEAHKNGSVWFADCNLEIDGKQFYAKAEAETLRNAIDQMVGDIGQEVRVAKQKQESVTRRQGSRIKDFFRFGR